MRNYIFAIVAILPLLAIGQNRAITTELSILGSYSAIMGNFESKIFQNNQNTFGYRVGFGVGLMNTNIQLFNVEGVYYRGNRHRLELAPFLTFGESVFKTEETNPLRERTLGLRIGYVYAPKSNNFMFKVGINPQYTAISRPISMTQKNYFNPYFGIGYRF